MTDERQGKLALEDGLVFTGRAFGAPGTVGGEVTFPALVKAVPRARQSRARSDYPHTAVALSSQEGASYFGRSRTTRVPSQLRRPRFQAEPRRLCAP